MAGGLWAAGLGAAAAACPQGLKETSSAYAARAYALSEQGDYAGASEQSWNAYCKERNLRFLVNICVFHLRGGHLDQAQEIVRLGRRRAAQARPEDRQALEQCAEDLRRQIAAAAEPAPASPPSASR